MDKPRELYAREEDNYSRFEGKNCTMVTHYTYIRGEHYDGVVEEVGFIQFIDDLSNGFVHCQDHTYNCENITNLPSLDKIIEF